MDPKELEKLNQEYRCEIERILSENNYLENYLYAEYVIKAFINDDRNFQRNRFFRITRTTRKIFEYSVEVVKFLNPQLYQEYLESKSDSEIKKKLHMQNNINKVALGIQTGHLIDGSKFDILDFYRFIPLRESCLNFVHDLKKFMRECDALVDGAYDTISNYMKENGIEEIIFVTERYIASNISFYSNDERVTPKVIHNCFRYMYAFGLPKIEAVFKIVLNRYLNHEIDFSNLKKVEDRSRKRKNEKNYHNPHTLELKMDSLNEKK